VSSSAPREVEVESSSSTRALPRHAREWISYRYKCERPNRGKPLPQGHGEGMKARWGACSWEKWHSTRCRRRVAKVTGLGFAQPTGVRSGLPCTSWYIYPGCWNPVD
jgi:hypothetical protein